MLIIAPNAAAVDGSAWRWPHFTPAELACKGDGSIKLETEFLDRLEKLRRMYGAPIIINSGYRSPAYNATVSSTGTNGPHTTGRAVDIRVAGTDAFQLVALAMVIGFTGLGLAQKGPVASRFVHLDDVVENPAIPRPAIW